MPSPGRFHRDESSPHEFKAVVGGGDLEELFGGGDPLVVGHRLHLGEGDRGIVRRRFYAGLLRGSTHGLVEETVNALRDRGMDRLHHAVPDSRALFIATAGRDGNLGSITQALIRLLDAHGARALNAAIAEALERGVPHVGAVRQILDRRRHERRLSCADAMSN